MKSLPFILAGMLLAVAPASRAGDQGASSVASDRPEIAVYKSPYCECCEGWAEHMTAHGYSVTMHDTDTLDVIKKTAGVPEALQSCHTAVVDGYAIEGHVPAAAVDRLLRERPAVTGIAVPGMPIGSPGMEGPHPEPYEVMSFDETGGSSVFMSIPAEK